MKNTLISRLAAGALVALILSGSIAFAQQTPTTEAAPDAGLASAPKSTAFARVVPPRQESFAWENDLVAFRTFGAPLPQGVVSSGIDCWLKRTPAPVISTWYTSEDFGPAHNSTSRQGYDPYEVGTSRGCGGDGIWKNDKLHTPVSFSDWKMVSRTPQQSVFELSYDYDVEGDKIHEDKRITIEQGKRLFRSQSTFTRDGKPATLDIGLGLTNHEGKALPNFGPQGWMSCWESIDGIGVGTGIVVAAPDRVREKRSTKSSDPNASHSLLIASTDANGQITWYSGYAWQSTKAITTADQWNNYLAQFAASLKQ